ncbi:DUF1573 domain-containing protein [Arcticibacterium luteifluviistationis]|uniref:DUF1573 domain-containing protein n=1 Tax=Arcticibacterium luteifluviistationis TaxID=1784714 RepID=A0A2Z4G8I7_9BACT|nr:DUF1573 domain-containing protein [Arcticibacterium luteifluviistationis]AWV97415.1 DUF1573 domain-containing protein [Arcticibacterium luteifluviistationis]
MKYIASLLLGLVLLSCNTTTTQEGAETSSLSNAEISFENPIHDFGAITEGDQVSHAFKFTNTGTDPLQITAVNVSCGCTVASKPMGMVGVGQSDEIVINFNSTGKLGVNKKTVAVLSNAKNNSEVLSFTAVVSKAEGDTETENL